MRGWTAPVARLTQEEMADLLDLRAVLTMGGGPFEPALRLQLMALDRAIAICKTHGNTAPPTPDLRRGARTDYERSPSDDNR